MSILTIIAIGQTFVIIAGGIDLSAGYVMGMVSVVAALTMNRCRRTPALAGCADRRHRGYLGRWIAGLVNGLLIARLNVPPFIATLGMFGIARGVGFLFSGGMPVPIYTDGLGLSRQWLSLLLPSKGRLVFLVAAGRTRAGRSAQADGGGSLRCSVYVCAAADRPSHLVAGTVWPAHLCHRRQQRGVPACWHSGGADG